MTPEELKHLEQMHNELRKINLVHGLDCDYVSGGRCDCGKDPQYITLTLSDTSQESLDKAIELYNQKQWWEI